MLAFALFACTRTPPEAALTPTDGLPAAGDAAATPDLENAAAGGWGIDVDLKLHLAYLRPPSPAAIAPDCREEPASLGLTEGFRPDIDNITLSGILDLGFPLPRPEHPERLSLFLKLFKAPVAVDLPAAARRLLSDFVVDGIEAKAPAVEAFISRPDHLAVKEAVIARSDSPWSLEHTFPGLVLDRCAADAQIDFSARVPFFSLYVIPASFWPMLAPSDDERAQTSRRGVTAFHAQLTRVYEKRLRELKGSEPEKFRSFIPADWQCTAAAPDCTLTVWKIMRVPLSFANWRELPMPQDPKRIFLSALLLVYRYEYAVDGRVLELGGGVGALDLADFQRSAVPSSARVMEVGSVVRLP